MMRIFSPTTTIANFHHFSYTLRMRYRSWFLVPFLALSIALAGCGTPAKPTPKATPKPAAAISGTHLATLLAVSFLKDQGIGKFNVTKPRSTTYLKKQVWEISFSAPEGLYLASDLYCPSLGKGKQAPAGSRVKYSELTGGKLYIEKTTPFEILGNEATFTYKHLIGACVHRNLTTPKPTPAFRPSPSPKPSSSSKG